MVVALICTSTCFINLGLLTKGLTSMKRSRGNSHRFEHVLRRSTHLWCRYVWDSTALMGIEWGLGCGMPGDLESFALFKSETSTLACSTDSNSACSMVTADSRFLTDLGWRREDASMARCLHPQGQRYRHRCWDMDVSALFFSLESDLLSISDSILEINSVNFVDLVNKESPSFFKLLYSWWRFSGNRRN